MANTTEHITIRLPKNLAERVRARAEAEGRSVSGMMTRLVQWAMEGRVDESPVIEAPIPSSLENCGFPVTSEHALTQPNDHVKRLQAIRGAAQHAAPERTVEYEE